MAARFEPGELGPERLGIAGFLADLRGIAGLLADFAGIA
jgi:hypothetical protein